jgi:hemerythrin-like metal-binding protein
MLFKKFNEFSAALSEPWALQNAGEFLDFLQFYSNWHFGEEENCMDEYKCPAAARNKQAHVEFMITFRQFYEEWQTGNMTPKMMSEIHVKMEKWLIHHVVQVDTHLRACVKNNASDP